MYDSRDNYRKQPLVFMVKDGRQKYAQEEFKAYMNKTVATRLTKFTQESIAQWK